MAIEKFPGANLIGQFLKQITEPLSKFIVKHVKKRPFIRKYVLIKLGYLYYWFEDKAGLPRIPAVAKKKRFNDIHMMELGAKLLIEILVVGLLWGVVIYETHKAVERSHIAEQIKIQEFKDLEVEKNQLMRRVKDQVILTKRLKNIIVEYSRQVGCTLSHDPEKNE